MVGSSPAARPAGTTRDFDSRSIHALIDGSSVRHAAPCFRLRSDRSCFQDSADVICRIGHRVGVRPSRVLESPWLVALPRPEQGRPNKPFAAHRATMARFTARFA